MSRWKPRVIQAAQNAGAVTSPARGRINKKRPPISRRLFGGFEPGDFLLSHTLARAVPSGLRGLTAVFGMGTGGSLSLWSPRKRLTTGGGESGSLNPAPTIFDGLFGK